MKKILTAALVLFTCVLSQAHGELIFDTIQMPSPAPTSYATAFDYSSDVRLVTCDGASVYLQDAIGSSSFTAFGSLPAGTGADPAFMERSPNASGYMIGCGAGGTISADNGKLFLMPTTGGVAPLAGTVECHFDGVWRNQTEMFLQTGNASYTLSQVRLFDVTTGNNSTVVVDNIQTASAGVMLDLEGNLYTTSGYGADKGKIKKFTAAELDNAISTGTPLDFATDGSLFYETDLSSYNMVLDGTGWMWITGFGYVERVKLDDTSMVNTYDPEGSGFAFYSFAAARDNHVAIGYQDWGTGNVYAFTTVVPEPSVIWLIVSAMAAAGFRRRSRAK